MIITDEHRMTLIKVMQRAAQVDISELMETELLRGAGGRVSPARAFDTLGDIKAIKEWDPDIPYRAIHWGLSLKENPMKKMAVVRKRENRIDWCLVHDASITMDFGTLDLTKRAFGLALGAIFSQAALKKCDRVAEVVFDDKKIGVLLEDASTEEMVLVGLAYDPANSLLRIPIDPSKNGISMSMTQLPEDRGI